MLRVAESAELTRLRAATERDPSNASAWIRLAGALSKVGPPSGVVACLHTALHRSGDTPQLLYALAVAQQTAGEGDAAVETYKRCLALEPSHPEALNNLGTLQQQGGQLSEAIQSFRQALRSRPGYIHALTNLGNALTSAGALSEAVGPLKEAVALAPQHAPALINLGNALLSTGRLQEALSRFHEAAAVAPNLAEPHFGQGRVLLEFGEMRAAAATFEQATQRRQDFIEAYELQARALVKCGDLQGAANVLERAASLNPRSPRGEVVRAGSHLLRGHALQTELRFPEALRAYNDALALNPDESEAVGGLLTCNLLMCDWQGTQASLRRLREMPGGTSTLPPLVLFGVSDDPQEHMHAGATLATAANSVPGVLPSTPRYGHRKIRLAYLSRDFCYHATSLLIAELFELHDRDQFELFGVSYGPRDDSAIRKRVIASLDRLLDGNGQTDLQIAQWLREHEIDIAVDLKGHTRGARTRILSYRPAPTQVNYLGYPGSMAAPFIDYFIADEFTVPPADQGFYAEKVVYLPDCYQVNDRQRAVSQKPMRRRDLGLPDGAFVFCSFNNNWKISREMFEVWMRLLAAVPESVLWLLEDNPWAAENLRVAARARGISPERLIFGPRMNIDEHLARQQLADLFLDTLPVNAHTTASDALWVGLPIVTCAGRAFPGRVAGSLLRAVGLEALITTSLPEYEALALRLATDPATLLSIRERLIQTRDESPLFDTPRFCRNLESAYRQMWERSERGESPESFRIERK